MKIITASESDYERMLEIWEAACRASHDFLTEDNIAFYKERMVSSYFKGVELWLALKWTGRAVAFMGVQPPLQGIINGKDIDRPAHLSMLFVHPRSHRRGFGRALVEHALKLYGPLAADVNEQNPGARRFYERCAFVVTGRSETDEEGNPFPILHLFRDLPVGK